MPTQTIRTLISGSRWAELKSLLGRTAAQGLAADWADLGPMEKLAVFKLLADGPALDLYDALSDSDKYFLFCGLEPMAIAPILENSSDAQRRLFVDRTPRIRDAMLKRLYPAEAACPS